MTLLDISAAIIKEVVEEVQNDHWIDNCDNGELKVFFPITLVFNINSQNMWDTKSTNALQSF